MKRTLLLLLLIYNFQLAFSQSFEVQAIKTSGDNDKRINLVILSEGYQESEMTKFHTDATNLMNDMFSQEPFSNYESYFNVYIIKVPSEESGATHPGTASDEPTNPAVPTLLNVNNYFGTTYDGFNIHRLLYTENVGLLNTVLANNFPEFDQALVLVNSPYYGGSGGDIPIASTGTDADEIVIHEIGHSFSDLKDEYYPGDILAEEAINMTQETDPTLVRWKNWMGQNSIGIFPYASTGTAATWYRPHQTCKMRYLGYDFCSVCKEGIIEKIHSLVSSVDSYSPSEATISDAEFPLDFQLNVIETLPTNTVEAMWTLNGNNFDADNFIATLEESDLNEGVNTLTAVVHDNSPLINVDNHETIHVSAVTWTIDNTLGVQDVIANDYSLTIYPNPSSTFVNIKLENNLNKDMRVDIISLDGKMVKSVSLQNNQDTQVDISNLSEGVYITNFYAEGILISSKKLIKN